MSEFKNVLKRLQDEEVKLSSEKVELNEAKDAAKFFEAAANDLKSALSIWDDFKKFKDDYTKKTKEFISKIEKKADSYKKNRIEGLKNSKAFEKKANELGIDYENTTPYKNEIKPTKSEMRKMADEFNSKIASGTQLPKL